MLGLLGTELGSILETFADGRTAEGRIGGLLPWLRAIVCSSPWGGGLI